MFDHFDWSDFDRQPVTHSLHNVQSISIDQQTLLRSETFRIFNRSDLLNLYTFQYIYELSKGVLVN